MAFTRQTRLGVTFHTCDAFTAAGGVAHGFATRLGGVSRPPFDTLNLGITRPDQRPAVRENYHRFCAALGVEETRLVMTHQVHGDGIREATPADVLPDLLDPIGYEADGLITDVPGLVLTVYYADCIPVLLYDPVRRAIGAVHSGWRGTSLAIAPQAVARMGERYGTQPQDVLAAIGPGIGPCCFETHEDVPAALEARLGPGVLVHCRPHPQVPGKYLVDLKAILAQTLRAAGLRPEHIHTLPLCTACHPELYWSHRKMGNARGNHGAMLALLP